MSPHFRRISLVAILLLALIRLEAANALVPRVLSVAPRGDLSVGLLVTNDTEANLEVVFPESLEGKVHSGTTLSAVVKLQRRQGVDKRQLAPGSFAQAEYTFSMPEGVRGPVVLDVPSSGGAPVMLSVQDRELAQQANQVAPASGSAEATRRDTALRRSTRLLPGVSAYEPVYFGMGLHGGVNAKFQVSLKYNPFDLWPFYLGYTQTSLWDLHSTSKPFRDTSYRPAFFLKDDSLWSSASGDFVLGSQAGFEHESNGKGGADSRSINIAFVRPRAEWRLSKYASLVVSPKIYAYIEKSENPDIGDYRGFVDLYVGLLYKDYRLSTTLRKGNKDWKGSTQVDLVLPLRSTDDFLSRLGVHGMNGFIFLQYFNGWGESILDYRRKLPSQVRAGIMLVP